MPTKLVPVKNLFSLWASLGLLIDCCIDCRSFLISSLFIKLLKAPQSVTDENISAYHKALDFLQDQLRIRGTKYFGGDQPAYVDYMNWPWFERILALEEVESRLRIDSNKYKLFVEYLELMKKDPVVSEYMIPNDILLKFIEPYRTGAEVNYELMTV